MEPITWELRNPINQAKFSSNSIIPLLWVVWVGLQLFSAHKKNRVMKYWLKGPKTGTMEDFAQVPGYPDNIRRTREGDFWVALHSRVTPLQYFLSKNWHLLRLLYCLPLPYKTIAAFTSSDPDGMAVKLNPQGEAIEALEDRSGKHTSFLSYAEERDGVLWMSSVFLPKIWTLTLNASGGNQTPS